MAERRLDLICIGRAAVDLYGEQVPSRIEDTLSFARYLGGCAANIAVGTSRLGLRPAMLARVGDEQMGRFVREQLAAEGVDVSRVTTDPERLTALVILGLRDRRTMPHIFYRTDCADMALEADDVEPGFIASARALLVTGTHFSTEKVDRASRTAIRYAKEAGTRVVFDIDYRPVLWGLTGHGAGESRFMASDTVTAHLQSILPDCDLVVGTEEEIAIAGGSTDTLSAVRNIRARSGATIVVKRGPMGCVVFPDAIPASIEDGIKGPGFPVEVFNTLGAGDGFMSGFLRGFLRDQPLEECARFGNACGAIVVSRHGCCPASPSWIELQHFLEHGSPHFRLREDPVLNHIHRATTRTGRWPEVLALAFDHRAQLEELADRAGDGRERIAAFKLLIAEAAREAAEAAKVEHPGILVDGRYGLNVLEQMAASGWWIGRPIELPGSRLLQFEGGPNVASTLRAWPAEHVVKCLVFYHPEDPDDLRAAQDRQLHTLYEACEQTRHELLLEVILPRDMPAGPDTLARALERIYGLGVFPDWWKLPPPDAAGWDAIEEVIERHDPYCRGVLLLGLEAPLDALRRDFEAAAGRRWCKGFAVGRSIFGAPAKAWLAGGMSDQDAVAAMAKTYRELIELWRSH
jgi:5-dehydro-2-deoxygluconokinase